MITEFQLGLVVGSFTVLIGTLIGIALKQRKNLKDLTAILQNANANTNVNVNPNANAGADAKETPESLYDKWKHSKSDY